MSTSATIAADNVVQFDFYSECIRGAQTKALGEGTDFLLAQGEASIVFPGVSSLLAFA